LFSGGFDIPQAAPIPPKPSPLFAPTAPTPPSGGTVVFSAGSAAPAPGPAAAALFNDEFSDRFGSAPKTTPTAARPPAIPTPDVDKIAGIKPLLPLILGLGGVLLAVLLLVVFFAAKG
jgi:hypothetical protein